MILGERLSLTYDSRDDAATTTAGSYRAVYTEVAHDFDHNAAPFQNTDWI